MKETPHTLGIIGDPLTTTWSPALHNAMCRRLGLPYVYIATPFPSRRLKHVRTWMRALDICGLNVTAPHKERIIPLLDQLAPCATACSAVNTIVVRRGALIGYNTDVAGITAALRHHSRRTLAGRTACIIGAGGAARSTAHALTAAGVAHIHILSRRLTPARRIGRSLDAATTFSCDTLSTPHLRHALGESSLCIQTSSAPLRGREALPRPRMSIARGVHIIDIRYGAPNPWLDWAEHAGARCADGYEMLINQAAHSFTLWTGHEADLRYWRRMRKQLTGQ